MSMISVNKSSSINVNTIRPSPNELKRLIEEERKIRRQKRILQVRNQDRNFAANIRRAVKDEKEKQLQLLARTVEYEFTLEKAEKLRKLQEEYENSLSYVGEAQKVALHLPDNSLKAHHKKLQQRLKAEQRYTLALEKLKNDQFEMEDEKNKQIRARNMAIAIEKDRAKEIASLPPPVTDDFLLPITINKPKPVKLTDVNAFSTTYYHFNSQVYVDKADENICELNAHQVAKVEEKNIEKNMQFRNDIDAERLEKAELRHKKALKKESMKHEYNSLIKELSVLQKWDATRRSHKFEKIPKKIFESSKIDEANIENRQRVLEKALEKEFMKATDNIGDISICVDPNPPSPTQSTGDSIIDTSEAHLSTPKPEKPVERLPKQLNSNDLTNEIKQVSNRPATLSKLLSRINCQRQNISFKSDSEVESFAGYIGQDHIPINNDSSDNSLSEYTLRSHSTPNTDRSVSKLKDSANHDVIRIPFAERDNNQQSDGSFTDTKTNNSSSSSHTNRNLMLDIEQININEQKALLQKQLDEIQEKKKTFEKMLSSSHNTSAANSSSSKTSSLDRKLLKINNMHERANKQYSQMKSTSTTNTNIQKIDDILSKIPSLSDRINKAGGKLGFFEDISSSLNSLSLTESSKSSDRAILLRSPRQIDTSGKVFSENTSKNSKNNDYDTSKIETAVETLDELNLDSHSNFVTSDLQPNTQPELYEMNNCDNDIIIDNQELKTSSLDDGLSQSIFISSQNTPKNVKNNEKNYESKNELHFSGISSPEYELNQSQLETVQRAKHLIDIAENYLENRNLDYDKEMFSRNSPDLQKEQLTWSKQLEEFKDNSKPENKLEDFSNGNDEIQEEHGNNSKIDPYKRSSENVSNNSSDINGKQSYSDKDISDISDSTKYKDFPELIALPETVLYNEALKAKSKFTEMQIQNDLDELTNFLKGEIVCESSNESKMASENNKLINSQIISSSKEKLNTDKISNDLLEFSTQQKTIQDDLMTFDDSTSLIEQHLDSKVELYSISECVENETGSLTTSPSKNEYVSLIQAPLSVLDEDSMEYSEVSPNKSLTNEVIEESKFAKNNDNEESIDNKFEFEEITPEKKEEYVSLIQAPLSVLDEDSMENEFLCPEVTPKKNISNEVLEESKFSLNNIKEKSIDNKFEFEERTPEKNVLSNKESGLVFPSPTQSRGDSTLSFEAHERSLFSDSSKMSASVHESPISYKGTPSPKMQKNLETVKEESKLENAEKKRRKLMEASEKRRAEAMDRARRKMEEQMESEKKKHDELMERWKTKRSVNGQKFATSKAATEISEESEKSNKNSEIDMKKRTDRLYNQLEEVKKQQAIKNRQEEYNKNREKAKAYSKKLEIRKKNKKP